MFSISSAFDDQVGFIDEQGIIYNLSHEPVLLIETDGSIRSPDGDRLLYFDEQWSIYRNDGERLGYIDENFQIFANNGAFICSVEDGRFLDPSGEVIFKIDTADQTIWRKFAAAYSFEDIPIFG